LLASGWRAARKELSRPARRRFSGAYKHLRDGILRFLDWLEDHAVIAVGATQFDTSAGRRVPFK
jgi:hypothetical protein